MASEQRGRPPTTSHEQIARVALELFAERGFEQTRVEEIAAALGIGRRTLFRYFPSKNDIVWGNFDFVLQRLRQDLAELREDLPTIEALGRAVVSSNSYPRDQQRDLRIRMTLITTVPALQAHSMLRYADWRAVVAEYVAHRHRMPVESLLAQTVAHCALATSMAAFSTWVQGVEPELERALETGFAQLAEGWPALASR